MKTHILNVKKELKQEITEIFSRHPKIKKVSSGDEKNQILLHLNTNANIESEKELFEEIKFDYRIISISSLKYLLSKGASQKLIFDSAINSEVSPLQEQMLELISNSHLEFKDFHSSCIPSIRSLEILLNIGLDANKALSWIIQSNIGQSFNNLKEKESLIKVMFENGADINKLGYIPFKSIEIIPFLIDNYNLNLEKGFDWILSYSTQEPITPNLVLSETKTEHEPELIKLKCNYLEKIIKKGIDLTSKSFGFNYLQQIEILEVFLNNGFPPSKIIQAFINKTQEMSLKELQENETKYSEIIKYSIESGGNVNDVSHYNLPQSIFLSKFAAVDQLLTKLLYEASCPKFNSSNRRYEDQSYNEEISKMIKFIEEKGIDINPGFDEYLKKSKNSIPSLEILKILIEKNLLHPNLLLMASISQTNPEAFKYALKSGAEVNFKIDGYNILEFALISSSDINFIMYIINKTHVDTINNIELLPSLICSFQFGEALTLLSSIQSNFSHEVFEEFLRAQGSSISDTICFIDYYHFLKQHIKHENTLSELESRILDPEGIVNYDDIRQSTLTNSMGYTMLQLLLIGNKIELAIKLIKDSEDLYTTNKNGTTLFQIYDIFSTQNEVSISIDEILADELATEIYSRLTNIDFSLGNGETLLDIFVRNEDLLDQIICDSKDPLLYFLKQNDDESNFASFPNDNKIHIAISHGEGLWSTGIFSFARLLMQNHPDVLFHLITLELVQKAGSDFLNKFDAFINPGADDSYPQNKVEFNLKDFSIDSDIEKLFHLTIATSLNNNIPSLGICGGAQHLILHTGGKLQPLKNYDSGKHEINFVKGTIPYFMSLKKEQKKALFEHKFSELPIIKFMGDTAHNYAGIGHKMKDLTLGATSEDGVPMAFAKKLSFATQYHPEHCYDNTTPRAEYQKAWLENFVEITRIYHNHKCDNTLVSPLDYLAQAQEHLNQMNLSGNVESLENDF